MEDPAVAPARPGSGAFEALLRSEQLANSYRLNVLRVIGAGAFVLLEWVSRQMQTQALDHDSLGLLGIYALAALGLLLVARLSERVAMVSRLGIPFLDMPAVYFIQHSNLLQTEAPRAVGNFSLALLIVLILLAALSLERWQIVLAAVVAVALQLTLHLQAGETMHGMLGGVILIACVTTLCDFARRRREEMVWALCGEQLRRERLGRYFSPLVASAIERTGDGMSVALQREVTVLFSDLRDFTTLAERLDTPEIVALLNDYFEHMVGVVFEHGGTLDKYIGDGLMIYFGAPVAQDDHAARAVRCALAMQESLAAYNSSRPCQAPLRMGIGIHTGTAVVGSIGASHRREYTAIGDTVNLAARIEQLCKPHSATILVSLDTKRLAGDAVKFREVTECTVKGRAASVQVFAPA